MECDTGFGRVFTYCPKCGAAAMRVAGSKLLRCEACGFELYMNPAAAVAGVIVDGQGRIVVTVRAREPGKGQWDLPGMSLVSICLMHCLFVLRKSSGNMVYQGEFPSKKVI